MASVNDNKYILDSKAPFAVAEGYKAFRSNLMFSLPDKGGKCIGFTSGARGDRKSSTAINTAISFAEFGKRVVLIDCDLRLPTVAKKLGINSVPGLSDLIVGHTNHAEINEIIRPYKNNLDVICCGTIPKDATGILASDRMRTLIKTLKNAYDYVIMDFPLVTPVTDAVLLADSVDGYVIVVHHEKSENSEVASVIRTLRMADANILGFVYTASPLVKEKYYSYK